jgi:di/tripeptidase
MSKKDKQSKVETGGAAYIGGNASAGRDLVGRDLITTIGDGNVNGDHSQATVIKQANQGGTIREFNDLLAELRTMLPQAELDAETAAVVDADVKVVQEQAGKPKPNGAIIISRLEGITKVLAAAGGLAVAGQKLLPMAQKAVEWAGQLFR